MVGRARRTPEQLASEYEEEVKEKPIPEKAIYKEDMVVSTGSTLLDKAISGGRHPEGGIPGGTVIEVFGPEGIGKTAIVAEICGSAQSQGGDVKFNDPEARLDREYAEIYGMSLPEGKYARLHYVNEIFDDIVDWDPPNKNVINVYGCDSLAALVTELEMSDSGDKMGMRRAKEFSQGFRKISTLIAEGGHKLLVCTNQIRSGDSGITTPGGWAIRYYSSIRLQIKYLFAPGKSKYLEETIDVGRKKLKKTIGINCEVYVVKNSKDDPYRKAPISIVFGYGIDDIRANLQYLKDMTGAKKYECGDGTEYQSMKNAISYVESAGTELKLKEKVLDMWDEIEEQFRDKALSRKRKER